MLSEKTKTMSFSTATITVFVTVAAALVFTVHWNFRLCSLSRGPPSTARRQGWVKHVHLPNVAKAIFYVEPPAVSELLDAWPPQATSWPDPLRHHLPDRTVYSPVKEGAPKSSAYIVSMISRSIWPCFSAVTCARAPVSLPTPPCDTETMGVIDYSEDQP